jgi:hypothetical protein
MSAASSVGYAPIWDHLAARFVKGVTKGFRVACAISVSASRLAPTMTLKFFFVLFVDGAAAQKQCFERVEAQFVHFDSQILRGLIGNQRKHFTKPLMQYHVCIRGMLIRFFISGKII